MKMLRELDQAESSWLMSIDVVDMVKREIIIPDGISVDIERLKISVSGAKGALEKDLFSPLFRDVKIEKTGNRIVITSESEKRKTKSIAGTMEAHIINMIRGVSDGYKYKLKIVYMHFPITVKVSGKEVIVQNFLGEKMPRKAEIIGDVKVEVRDDEIIVSGINKEDVGQTAANIERATWIKARDRRIFQDGIFLVSRD